MERPVKLNKFMNLLFRIARDKGFSRYCVENGIDTDDQLECEDYINDMLEVDI